MMSYETQQGIYLGSRDEKFDSFIRGLLIKGGIKEKYVEMLTDKDGMKLYASAFTSELVDPNNNYQVLEQVGDLTGNKFIVNYMYNRFPQLDCSEGVKVVARLRINYGAKQSFSEIARKLGFWEFISATNELRLRMMKPLLEDVFEAFLGATERILDKKKRIGVGYAIVHDLLANIFDEIDISLKYEDLYDAKTRLKELFDMHEHALGPLVYKDEKLDTYTRSSAYRVDGGKYKEIIQPDGSVTINKKKIMGGVYVKIGEGYASLKSDAQQNAARDAIRVLNKSGWFKLAPAVYRKFNDNIDEKTVNVTPDILKEKFKEGVNELYNTKEKNKYQFNYKSTPISLYCRTRNINGVKSCIGLGSDPNITDSECMFPTDLLFIGCTDEKIVEDIIRVMISTESIKLNIHKNVFNMYCREYVGEYFVNILNRFNIVKDDIT